MGGSRDGYKYHPDVFAARVELAQLYFAHGKMEDCEEVAQAALGDVELYEQLEDEPGTVVQRAQLAKEFAILRVFDRTSIQQRSLQPGRNQIPVDESMATAEEIFEPLQVTQDVQHADPAADIPHEETASISRELWASAVQRLACKPLKATHSGLILITFSRHSATLHKALLDAPLVKQLSHDGVDVLPDWANGAFVLAPIQAEDIDM